jgi:hypothetical protein
VRRLSGAGSGRDLSGGSGLMLFVFGVAGIFLAIFNVFLLMLRLLGGNRS